MYSVHKIGLDLSVNFFLFFLFGNITGSDSSERGQDRNRHRSGSSYSSDVQSQQETDKVSVNVYADGTYNCEKAINQLKKAVKDEWIVSNLKESVILTMPQKKVGLQH